MGRRKKSDGLRVALNGRIVGTLTRTSDGATRFAYDRDWLDWEHAIAVSRSMPLNDRPYLGSGALSYFDNLLPDNSSIIKRIASRIGSEGTDTFSMLKALGRDCVGALQFVSEDETPAQPGRPEGVPVSESKVAERVNSLAFAPLGMHGGSNAFRISLAGAQDKTALLFHESRWMEPVGTTPTTNILKPQIGIIRTVDGNVDMTESVQNEHFCLELCGRLGLKVAKTEILRLPGDLLVLNVERFDRKIDSAGRIVRLPQEDLCQALGVPPNRKYEKNPNPLMDGGPGIGDCLNLLKTSNSSMDHRTFIKTQIIFWLIGATDGHAKNFSLFLGSHGKFVLTPLYDILSAQWQYDRSQITRKNFQVAMAVGDKRRYRIEEIHPRHFEQTAKKTGFHVSALLDVMKEITEALPEALRKTREVMDETVPPEMMDSISSAATRRAEMIDKYLAG